MPIDPVDFSIRACAEHTVLHPYTTTPAALRFSYSCDVKTIT